MVQNANLAWQWKMYIQNSVFLWVHYLSVFVQHNLPDKTSRIMSFHHNQSEKASQILSKSSLSGNVPLLYFLLIWLATFANGKDILLVIQFFSCFLHFSVPLSHRLYQPTDIQEIISCSLFWWLTSRRTFDKLIIVLQHCICWSNVCTFSCCCSWYKGLVSSIMC